MVTGDVCICVAGRGRAVSVARMGDVACGELGDVVVFVAAGGSLGGEARASLGNDVWNVSAWADDML